MHGIEHTVEEIIEEYTLISEEERVAVACSGGKDSTTTLYLLDKLGYEPEAMIIDLMIGNWSQKNLENLETFCTAGDIPLHVVSMREEIGFGMCYVRDMAKQKLGLADCTACGIVRKWLINKKAKELGFDVVATGHNLDDGAQTVLMNVMHGKPRLSASLGPRADAMKAQGYAARIKPLYFCLEKEVAAYSRSHRFPVLYERCPCSMGAFRREVRSMLDRLEEAKPGTKKNIIDRFEKLAPEMRTENGKMNNCARCGAPCRSEVCSACTVLEALHG